MSRHAKPAPRRNAKKTAAAIAAAGLLVTAGGVYAGLTAIATNTTPETVSSGTLKLVMADNGAGFSQNISNVAPGDVINRFVDVSNTGTLAAQNLTLGVTDSVGSLLSTSATKGLQVTVQSCSVAWVVNAVANTGTCADLLGPTTVVAQTPMSTLGTQTLVNGAVAGPYHYMVSLQLPDQNETTTNGTLPAGTIQGLTASLTWTFSEAQRAATTTNS
jgi:hypothetical protein